jgi:hypothetical protein
MKVKDLENERDCLVTTLKLLHLDRKDSEKQPETSGWRKVKSNGPAKTSDNYLPVITSNRYEILEEESKNESYVINDDQVIHTEDVNLQTKRYNHGKTIRTDKAKSKPKENANANKEKSVKTTNIVGDSMIKHLDCHRLKRSVQNGNKRVHV